MINRNIETVIHYPDPEQTGLRQAAADYYSISADRVIFGNGASEFISLLPKILDIDHLIIPIPSYSEYNNRKIQTSYLKLSDEDGFALNFEKLQILLNSSRGRKLVFIGQPNNPTGKSVEISELKDIAANNEKTMFCIDESFSDFIPGYSSLATKLLPNIIIIKSLTKFYGIPGLRLGLCICSPNIINKIKTDQTPWSVNILAQKIGEKLFTDKLFFDKSITTVKNLKKQLTDDLSNFNWLKLYPGEANFILIKITNPSINFDQLDAHFLRDNIIIRNCSNFYGLKNSFFRIAVKTAYENKQLINSLKSFSHNIDINRGIQDYQYKNNQYRKREAKPLMIQGTASNAGKSILVAGLCRILYQDGYNVAPFKAQNMSNNSAVTINGKEIGRAQALQARACNLTPDVRMNPVLLKPSSDSRSQVIINGIAKGYMTGKNWKTFKAGIRKDVENSYDSLSAEYEIVILEGAGSPGEVNLKENDIVNMGMARYANTPVLIVGDIDRGGVYASLIGTMDVFEEWERNLVKGFIINRFRGNSDLLKDAHDYIFEYTGRTVLGTVPFINNLNLPEEDSVSLKEGSYFKKPSKGSPLKIALIDLPHISNFTDIDPLRMENDIEICLIVNSETLDNSFSAIIIPGSKNTTGDLQWLRKKGFQSKLRAMNNEGILIVGICGGFQILGKTILDSQQIESPEGKNNNLSKGLGFLDIETTFHPDKQLKLVKSI
ncbi:MAG: cobyric acid synthase, partial [Spirochaetales bacterium]|nr:cobyric acid synthase [Spirochaetales bacterium]